MDYRVSAQERAAFKRCRRQWDFGSANRQHLQAVGPAATGRRPGPARRARRVLLPRHVGLAERHRAAAGPQGVHAHDGGGTVVARARRRLRRRKCTAGAVLRLGTELDDFCPLKIETDVESLCRTPGKPDRT